MSRSHRAIDVDRRSHDRLAVLTSGGLDSAVLVGETLAAGREVAPLYVRCGLRWEEAELDHARRFLHAIRQPLLRPLCVLHMPVADLYDNHWSFMGEPPDAQSPDEAVYVPGRNVLLLAKALLWCHLHGWPELAIGSLARNPFADATPAFLAAFAAAVNEAVAGGVRVVQPYGALPKREVMRRGAGLALGLTFSCLAPRDGLHCGRCNKCAERRASFADAGLADPTTYYAGPEPTAALPSGQGRAPHRPQVAEPAHKPDLS
jgi:7-cyano-7-deazaguanine synthase